LGMRALNMLRLGAKFGEIWGYFASHVYQRKLWGIWHRAFPMREVYVICKSFENVDWRKCFVKNLERVTIIMRCLQFLN